MRSLVRACVCSFVRVCVRSFVLASVRLFACLQACVCSFVRACERAFVRYVFHSFSLFIRSFVLSFLCSLGLSFFHSFVRWSW